ncbi:MAG: hypothetical protein E7171_03585 [Firmicutes bacterium]|nr:hypothetical protein [Bacillota bacterium]
MTQKVHNTLRNFISSNNAFCDALKQEQIYIDDNILLELIIYYLRLNKSALNILPEQDRYLINELINRHNFYISDNKVVIGEHEVSITYLKHLVLELDSQISTLQKGRVIYLHDISTKELRIRSHQYTTGAKLRVIPFDDTKATTYYTHVDREREYEITSKINPKTRRYIKETKDNFIALVNDVVHKALTNSLDDYSIKYLKVIASYLQLYPFTTYLNGKRKVPYEVLTIDQNKIGIRKTTYSNPELNRLKRELVSLLRYQQQLEYDQEREVHDEHIKSHQLTLTEQALLNVDKDKLRTMLEIYELEHSPSIYNKNLIEHLALSFEQGTVSINRFFANPLLRIFLNDSENSYFHCSIHLETLFNLVNTNQLLEELEDNKILRLPV